MQEYLISAIGSGVIFLYAFLFGAADKDNEPQRTIWTSYVMDKARSMGISCIWWDAGGNEEKKVSYSLYNRYSNKWRFAELLEALVRDNQ